MTPDLDVGCVDVRELSSSYLDGELPTATAAAVARHLASCAACADAYRSFSAASAKLRAQLPPLSAPDLLRARVQSAVHEAAAEAAAEAAPSSASDRRPHSRHTWWARQIAAGLVIAAASSLLTVASMRRAAPLGEEIAHDVIASYVRSLMTHHPTDVTSSDQHNVKPWFNGKVTFSPEVHRLDDAGFPLVGGRVDFVGDHVVAALVYGRREHAIDVYSWPASAGDPVPNETIGPTVARGFNALRWGHHGMIFWAVSDLNAGELRQFVEAFRKQAGP